MRQLAIVIACLLMSGSAFAQVNSAALKTELQGDPTAIGYAASVTSGNDAQTAIVINTVRAGITIRRSDITPLEIATAIDVADYTSVGATPTAAQLSTERRYLAWLTGIFSLPTVRLLNDDGTNTLVITNFQTMFAAGTGTRTRLTALAVRTGSRAEQLFGVGTQVTAVDVAKALR